MQILESKSGKHWLLINDDDEGYAEDGVQVMVLTGAEFEELLVYLPIDKANALLDKHYGANFKYHCNIMHYSNKSRTICQGCGEILELTSKEDHAEACRQAEGDQLLRMAEIFNNLRTKANVRIVVRS
jgi:hypothetical protein